MIEARSLGAQSISDAWVLTGRRPLALEAQAPVAQD